MLTRTKVVCESSHKGGEEELSEHPVRNESQRKEGGVIDVVAAIVIGQQYQYHVQLSPQECNESTRRLSEMVHKVSDPERHQTVG